MKIDKKRFVGLDVLRIVLILPTIMLHVWNIIFSESHVSFSPEQSLYPFYENTLGRLFGYSGVFIFSLSFFLYGLRRHSLFKFKPLHEYIKLALLIGAMVSTQFNDSMNIQDSDFFIWDIFSFVLLSYLVISLLDLIKQQVFLKVIFVSGFLLFLLPISFYAQSLDGVFPPSLAPIFIATQTSFGHNGWFLLPWLGLPLIFYPLGRLFQSFDFDKKTSLKYGVPLFLIGGLLWFFTPEKIPPALGSLFYQYIFWQSPGAILARLTLFISLLLMLSSGSWSKKWNLFSWLQWNRNFWLCYIVHFGVIDLLSDHKEFFAQNLFYLDWLWLAVFLGVEILIQLFFFVTKIYKWLLLKILHLFTERKS